MYRKPTELRVLVVDDDREFQNIISHYLTEDPEYSVVSVDSGQQALDMLREQSFSAIIADYQMPEMDGLDLLRIIRSQGNSIPFIIFTGQGCEEVAIDALNAGADFYLVKGEDPAPQFLALRMNLSKIIAKQQADEALRISEAENRKMLSLLKATLEATEDGILVETMDREIVGHNERFLKMFNLEKSQVEGKTGAEIWALVSDQIKPGSDPMVQGKTSGTSQPVLLSFRDGRVIESHARPQICDGNVMGRVWSYHDLTERVRAEDALRESEAFNRGLVDNLPDYVMIYERTGKILYINSSGIAGLRAEEKNPVGNLIYQYLLPEHHRIVREKVERRFMQEDVPPYEVRIVKSDNTVLDVMVQATVIPYRGSDVILGVLTDITSRKEGEEALERYAQTLQVTVNALATANKKLNLLSDVTRHDILNQVHIILSYLDIVASEKMPDGQRKMLQRIEEATSIIHRQIQFTRSYQDLGVNKPEWQNVKKTIDFLTSHGIPVQNEVSGLTIFADPLLPKVFENLLDNAIRHGGEITKIRVTADQRDDGAMRLRWSDNGVGISPDEKEKIFEKGFGNNTGFGMFLIREILALTGISIREIGSEGAGACFEMIIPRGSYILQ
ncbi:response regulator [uncultured Methanospirillum sp.]|uniref:response regulator n=1 Tax=uncultured Methanospirillum sp. TaxID=262503 RepID=UPI0029C6A607|nr:response regulator [uncultured Methanospirillum sp.]